MQRILPRGEIEGLDHTRIPRLARPRPAFVFRERAERLRRLAQDNEAKDYLRLIAHLCDAQHDALARYDKLPGASGERMDLAQKHGMPPLQAAGWLRDAQWLEMLRDILRHVSAQGDAPEAARRIAADLLADAADHAALVEAQADAILARFEEGLDMARAPFIMAALQVYWTRLAIDLDEAQLPVVSPFGTCPCCGSLPVSTIVRIGGARDGCRYAVCALCSTEWHIVRVTCTHCQDTEKIAFYSIEGGREAIKAESCGKCGAYRKILYQEKDHDVDGVADDLASLPLDMLMGEEGFVRVSHNPFLWQQSADA